MKQYHKNTHKALSRTFGSILGDIIAKLHWRYKWAIEHEDRGYFYESVRNISDDADISKTTVMKHLVFLEQIGLIRRGKYIHGNQDFLKPKERRGSISVIEFNIEGYKTLLTLDPPKKLKTSQKFFEFIQLVNKQKPFVSFMESSDNLVQKYFTKRFLVPEMVQEKGVFVPKLVQENSEHYILTNITKNPSTTFLLSEFEKELVNECQMKHEDEDFSLKNTSGKKLTDADFFVVENEFDSLGCVYQFSDNEEINESKVSSEYELRYETSEFLRDEDMRTGNIQIEEKSSSASEVNDRNISSAKKNLPVSTDYFEYKCAEFIWNQVLKQYDKAKKPDLNRWAKEVSKMIRIDKRDEGEIRRILKFIYSPGGDQFWQTVIQSPTGLRRNFDKIAIKANNASKQPQNQFNGSGGARVFWTAKEQEEMRYKEKREALYAKWEMQKKDPDYVPVEPMSMDVDLGG